MKHYLKLLALFTLIILIFFCALSYWIDPYGIYPHQNELFPRKVAAANRSRTVKPYQVQNLTPYTLLVGNSRVELGMPVSHTFYQEKPAYNMGLPGAGIAMQYDYAMHAVKSTDSVKQVVIALDFLDFTTRMDTSSIKPRPERWRWRLVNDDVAPSFDQLKKRYAERLSFLFSLSAITDSVETIVAQNSSANALDTYGFMDGRLFYFHVASEGFGALYRQKEAELDSRLSSQQLIFTEQSGYVTELDQFIRLLKQHNIDIYLIINPYQQPYLDKLFQYQLGDHFSNWKHQMKQLAASHSLSLFDFAIPSPLVTEVVSPDSRNVKDSPYFWEPAHYRKAFGALILNTLLTGECNELCQR